MYPSFTHFLSLFEASPLQKKSARMISLGLNEQEERQISSFLDNLSLEDNDGDFYGKAALCLRDCNASCSLPSLDALDDSLSPQADLIQGKALHSSCAWRLVWNCPCGDNPVLIYAPYTHSNTILAIPADLGVYLNTPDLCFCETCDFCFWNRRIMTRPKGAPNSGPSKAVLVSVLKKPALLNEHGRADGTAIKDLSRNTLQEMVRKAGLEAELNNEMAKKVVGMQKYLPSKSAANSSSTINLSDPTPNLEVITNANANADEEDDSEYEDPPINQGNLPEPGLANPPPIESISNFWISELHNLGYSSTSMIAPNKVVQLILGCIRNEDVHRHFIWRETNLREGDFSAIMFLGTNNILDLATKFNKVNYDPASCIALIDETYALMPNAIYEASIADQGNVQAYIKGLTALEKANGVKITNPPVNKMPTKAKAAAPTTQISFDTCLFDLSNLTENERNSILGINPNNVTAALPPVDDPADDYKLKNLNLSNCCCFPIISPRLVESLSQRHSQALWLSKNLGVIAPLSADTWIKLAGINPDEVKQAEQNADNLYRTVDRMDVIFPFQISFFGKDCTKGDGFIMGQKDHMAKQEEKRNDFYIKKIWRTFCPYIKCNCQKYTRRKNECLDGGIKWFDHAIWYFMNHLEAVWPSHSATVRFALFSSMLRAEPVRTAVIAYISFLRVRKMLVDMTKRYADDPSANLCLEFGNTKLTEVLEKTIRPAKFLIGKAAGSSSNTETPNYKRKLMLLSAEDSDVLLPPSIFKKPEITFTPTSSSYADQSGHSNQDIEAANSVNKTPAGNVSRTAGTIGTRISY